MAKKFASTFPTPPQLFTIDYLGGWSKVQGQVLRPDQWVDHQDRAGRGGAHCLLAQSPLRPRPRSRRGRSLLGRRGFVPYRARPSPAAGWRWDLSTLYVSVIVLIPLAAVTVKAVSQSPVELLGVRHQPDVAQGAGHHARRLAADGGHRRGDGNPSSPGCWSATGSPASGSSTRSLTCPSHCRPSSPG